MGDPRDEGGQEGGVEGGVGLVPCVVACEERGVREGGMEGGRGVGRDGGKVLVERDVQVGAQFEKRRGGWRHVEEKEGWREGGREGGTEKEDFNSCFCSDLESVSKRVVDE